MVADWWQSGGDAIVHQLGQFCPVLYQSFEVELIAVPESFEHEKRVLEEQYSLE